MVALQVIGSPTSEFFFNLSLLYAKDVIQPNGFKLLFATVYPDEKWTVDEVVGGKSEKISLTDMISRVQHANVVVPHLFCETGLTSFRILFEEILKIPLVGSSGHTLRMAQNKKLSKLLVEAAGVTVPVDKLIHVSEIDTIDVSIFDYPVIVKPNHADNSEGLSIITESEGFMEGLEKACDFDEHVLIETFIPGREIRGAVLEHGGVFKALPFIEYSVTESNPIRTRTDKLKFDDNGNLLSQSEKLNIPAISPAELTKELSTTLQKAMIACHKALGCRDFSMYDFRIDKNTGEPFFLEAGLFWSFSDKSMISTMLKAASMSLEDVTSDLWFQALKRGKIPLLLK